MQKTRPRRNALWGLVLLQVFLFFRGAGAGGRLAAGPVSYTHLRAPETDSYLVCRLLLEKKKNKKKM